MRALRGSGLSAATHIDYGENVETPLMKAARSGTLEIARLLLARGADVNVQDSEQTPALEAAISR